MKTIYKISIALGLLLASLVFIPGVTAKELAVYGAARPNDSVITIDLNDGAHNWSVSSNIGQRMYFKVADSDQIRYYPYVERPIGDNETTWNYWNVAAPSENVKQLTEWA